MGNHLSEQREEELFLNEDRRRSSTISNISVEESTSREEESNEETATAQKKDPSPDCEEVPIDDRFSRRLKGIDSEIRHSAGHAGSHSVALDKIHIGFVGFGGSGKSSLIRSILGVPSAIARGEAGDRRSRFRKSRSVHFSECVNSCLVPWYFRNLSSIVLWEISYPFEPVLHLSDHRLDKREEKLRHFFIENRLNKFCLMFLCMDSQDIGEEDLAFARVARAHGTKLVFLQTKSDLRMGGARAEEERDAFLSRAEEERDAFLSRERILFSSKLNAMAPELADVPCFFVSSKVLPGLMRDSEEKGIVALRDIEKLPVGSIHGINEEESSRRHTMNVIRPEEGEPDEEWRDFLLEEDRLIHFIVQYIDNFQVEGDQEEG